MERKRRPRVRTKVLAGVAAAPGIAVGPAQRLEEPVPPIVERELQKGEVEAEVDRFLLAIEESSAELAALRETTVHDLGEDSARIFDVQLMVLADPLAVDRTLEAIRQERKNAEFLFRRHMMEMVERLEALSDDYFSERAIDLLDVKRRVLRRLQGTPESPAMRRGVLMGREIAPSDAVRLDPRIVLGVATDSGGATGHAAIMARARGIPAVVGVRGLCESVRDGDVLAVDGFRGRVEINPGPESLERLRTRQRAFRRLERRRMKLTSLPAETRDGRRIGLSANMELPDELEYIRARGVDGIGLFRTEFFFMQNRQAPTEEEQVAVYRQILEGIAPQPVVFRVLDLGGDKAASYLGIAKEQNPFLGLRGIRYLAAHPDVFRTQLRAILRANAEGKARILLPMVSSLDELRHARSLAKSAIASLRKSQEAVNPDPLIGVMIEVPSAVFMVEEMAREADFLSVGSNDLIQYLLAIDRGNEALQDLYQPFHPAVLRAFRATVDAGHRHGKEVSICGEMASDPLASPLLLGLGFDRLSVSPYMVPEVKQTVRSLDEGTCRELAVDALAAESALGVLRLVEERLGSSFSEFLSLTRENGAGPTRGRPGKRLR